MLTTEAKKLSDQISYAVQHEFESRGKEFCKDLSWKTVTDEEIAELHKKLDEIIQDYKNRDMLITDVNGLRSLSYTKEIHMYIHREGVSNWCHVIPEVESLKTETQKKCRMLQDIVWSYPDEEQLKEVLEYINSWKREIVCT